TVDLPGGIALRADSTALVDSLLGMRAFRAFDASAAHFPIHRELRFSSRRALDELFDDIATQVAPRAHRLSVDAILMESDGLLASVTGRRKNDYTSATVRVWASAIERVWELERRVAAVVG